MDIFCCVIFLIALAYMCTIIINIDNKKMHDWQAKIKKCLAALFSYF